MWNGTHSTGNMEPQMARAARIKALSESASDSVIRVNPSDPWSEILEVNPCKGVSQCPIRGSKSDSVFLDRFLRFLRPISSPSPRPLILNQRHISVQFILRSLATENGSAVQIPLRAVQNHIHTTHQKGNNVERHSLNREDGTTDGTSSTDQSLERISIRLSHPCQSE